MCFSLEWLQHLLILAVVVTAVWAILSIIVPWALGKLGAPLGEAVGIISQVVRILVWAVIIIFVIYIVFMMISCLLTMGGGFSLMPRRGSLVPAVQQLLASW